MDSDFLSIVDPDKFNVPPLNRMYDWWSQFCSESLDTQTPLTHIVNRVKQYNGTMVRAPNNGPWIGIKFKTVKDKLVFQLKFQ